jgi:hypothetical protein
MPPWPAGRGEQLAGAGLERRGKQLTGVGSIRGRRTPVRALRRRIHAVRGGGGGGGGSATKSALGRFAGVARF